MRVHAALAFAAGLVFAAGAALADSMSTPSSNSMSSPMSSSSTMSAGSMSSSGHMSSDHMAGPGTHKHTKKHTAGAMQSGSMASGAGDSMSPANTQTH